MSKTADAEHDTQPASGQQSEANTETLEKPAFAPDRVPAAIEALLLTMDKALAPGKIAEATGMRDHPGIFPKPSQTIEAAIEVLNEEYAKTGRSFRVESVAGGYRIMTLPEFAPAIAAIQGLRESSKLSRAAIETLAIVAYRQPITRVQIESIRGVACGEVLRGLMEKNLVTIAGRAEELGRPLLYGTTKRFLEVFGLAAIKDLPPVNDVFPGLSNLITEQKPASKAVAQEAGDPEDGATPAEKSPEPQTTSAETESGDNA
jgi:segregation and condensation protein B